MYTLDLNTGIVTRDSDGVQVAPAQDINDVNYQEYLTWVNAGNHPTEIQQISHDRRCITKLAFRYRFTTQERIGIEYASTSQDADTHDVALFRAALRVYLEDLNNADFIDLSSETLGQAMSQLVQFGLVTAERADEILTDPIQPDEVCEV